MLIGDHKISVEYTKGPATLTMQGPIMGVRAGITIAQLEELVTELSREAVSWRRRIVESPYQVLGVPRDANDEAIKQAFRKQMQVHHPDRGGSPEKAKAINASYELLSNAELRRTYDQTFEREGGAS